MENSKIIARLRILSEQEMKDFILFADSPYFNSNAALTRLLKYLQKYHPDLKGTKLAKELVYRKVFPEKAVFKEKRLSDLMTQLFKLSEDFLAFDKFKKSPVSRVRHELLAYRDNNMDKDFQKAVLKTEKILSAQIKDENYYLEQYLLNKEVYESPSTERIKSAPDSLKATMGNLDSFFFTEKIKLSSVIRNREKIFKEKYEIVLLDEVKRECATLQESNKSLFFANKILHVVETEELLTTQELCRTVKIISPNLTHEAKQTYVFILLNILSRKFRAGNDEVTADIFSLYKFAERENILLSNGKVTLPTFSNACIAAVKESEKEWQKMFFDKYKNLITPEKNRDDAINLVKSSILFEEVTMSQEKGRFKKIIHLINALSFQNQNYIYKVKSQLLRLYLLDFIETKNFEELEFLLHFCHAFETQLYRNKKWNSERTGVFLNTVSVTKRLAKSIFDNEKEKIKALIKELQSSSGFFSRNWFIKIAENEL